MKLKANNSRLIIVDPNTGCVESCTKVAGCEHEDTLRHMAGALAYSKSLMPERIKS